MTQRNKNIVLVIVVIIVFFAVYHLSIAKTIFYAQEVERLESEIVKYDSLDSNLIRYNQQLEQINSIITDFETSGVLNQSSVLEELNKSSDSTGVSLQKFNEPIPYLWNNVDSTLYSFTLEGNYNELLEFLFDIEQKKRLGQIISFTFRKEKNLRQNTHYLQLDILLRRI